MFLWDLLAVIGAGLAFAGFFVLCLVRFDCSLLRGANLLDRGSLRGHCASNSHCVRLSACMAGEPDDAVEHLLASPELALVDPALARNSGKTFASWATCPRPFKRHPRLGL